MWIFDWWVSMFLRKIFYAEFYARFPLKIGLWLKNQTNKKSKKRTKSHIQKNGCWQRGLAKNY